jgi:hypothetical protein
MYYYLVATTLRVPKGGLGFVCKRWEWLLWWWWCVYVCFVELWSVLGWHAKVEEELVVCEILLTTTNLWDWVINNFFFLDDMQNEKKFESPFDYNKFMGLSYKTNFFDNM